MILPGKTYQEWVLKNKVFKLISRIILPGKTYQEWVLEMMSSEEKHNVFHRKISIENKQKKTKTRRKTWSHD